MSESRELSFARDSAEIITAGDFDLNDADREDLVFLLTAANLAIGPLRQRRNVEGFYHYAIENKRELLSLSHDFDHAIQRFNQTADGKTDEALINTRATRSENKLGRDGTIPFLLGEPRTHNDIKAGNRAFRDVGRFMKNSELAETDPELLEEITKEGLWSRIHLDAKSPKHFLATFIVDLYPMMLTRTGKYGETDPDELVRALCENLDPKSELFKLINEQWGFTEAEYSAEFVDRTNKKLPLESKERTAFSGTVRDLQERDLDALRPILAAWIKDRDTGEELPGEVEEDLEIMSDSVSGENDRRYFVAEENGEVIGVIGMKKPDDRMLPFCETDNPVELVNAYVKSDKRKGQGGGVGTALVTRLEEEARKMGKTEVVLNSGPRYEKTGWGFYDKLSGYQRVGIAKEYYGENGDAPVWRKIL